MKTLLKFILAMTVVGFFAACNASDDFEIENADSFKHHENKMVELGFNVVFTGEYQLPPNAEEPCGEGTFSVHNTGEGTGTHFKKLTSYFDFCVRPTATGGSYPEGYIEAYLEDENGDKLFVYVSGEVIGGRVPGMPSYALSYFKDPFVITGGTGKFENASGEGVTNDYNFVTKDGIQRTSHHWQGKIIMKKGK